MTHTPADNLVAIVILIVAVIWITLAFVWIMRKPPPIRSTVSGVEIRFIREYAMRDQYYIQWRQLFTNGAVTVWYTAKFIDFNTLSRGERLEIYNQANGRA